MRHQKEEPGSWLCGCLTLPHPNFREPGTWGRVGDRGKTEAPECGGLQLNFYLCLALTSDPQTLHLQSGSRGELYGCRGLHDTHTEGHLASWVFLCPTAGAKSSLACWHPHILAHIPSNEQLPHPYLPTQEAFPSNLYPRLPSPPSGPVLTPTGAVFPTQVSRPAC